MVREDRWQRGRVRSDERRAINSRRKERERAVLTESDATIRIVEGRQEPWEGDRFKALGNLLS